MQEQERRAFSGSHHVEIRIIRPNRQMLHGCSFAAAIAFSSEVKTGSREENASKQEFKAFSVLVRLEAKRL